MSQEQPSKTALIDAIVRLLEFGTFTLEDFKALGGSDDDLKAAFASRKLRRKVALLLHGDPAADEAPLPEGPYNVFTDYSVKLPDRIRVGCYDYVNPGFESCTIVSGGYGSAKRAIWLVELKKLMSLEDAKRSVESQGERPVTLEPFLDLGAAFPDVQRKRRLVELGTDVVVNGTPYFAGLFGSAKQRILQLHRLSDEVGPGTRIPVIRKAA